MTPERPTDADRPEGGVLAALPRTRPQRASARREATRARAQSETPAPASARKRASAAAARGDGAQTGKAKSEKQPVKQSAAKPAGTSKTSAKSKSTRVSAPARPAVKRRPAPPGPERAPRQGYEPEEEVELGQTVNPPSGGELIESIVDIFGELAGAGASAGGRLLKDALSVFRRP